MKTGSGETFPDLADVLRYVAPPLPVVDLLRENADRLTPAGADWLRRWEAIRAGDPVPVLDCFGKGAGDGIQKD